jgi:hypothetical protein
MRRWVSNRARFDAVAVLQRCGHYHDQQKAEGVSVTMNRFRPLIFSRPTVSAPRPLWESISSALGAGAQPSCPRSCATDAAS